MKQICKNQLLFFLVILSVAVFGQHTDSKRIVELKSKLAKKNYSEQTPILFDIANIYLSENTDSTLKFVHILDKRISNESEHKIRLQLLKIRQALYVFDLASAKRIISHFENKIIQ